MRILIADNAFCVRRRVIKKGIIMMEIQVAKRPTECAEF